MRMLLKRFLAFRGWIQTMKKLIFFGGDCVKLASIAEMAWEAGLQLEAVKYINLALALDAERENWQRWKAEWER